MEIAKMLVGGFMISMLLTVLILFIAYTILSIAHYIKWQKGRYK
jgi:Na+/H+ antiporter NhaC